MIVCEMMSEASSKGNEEVTLREVTTVLYLLHQPLSRQ